MTLRQALASGHANKVDVIAGTDRDEDLVGTATTAAQYTSLVDTQYGSFASQVLAKYPLSHFDNPGVAWRTVAADSDTVCPSLETAQDLASRMPTREYEIDDNDIPPYQAAGSGSSRRGRPRRGVVPDPGDSGSGRNQQVLQDNELAFVTAFARNGNPNTNGVPVWPKLNNTSDVMSLQPAGDSELVTTDEWRRSTTAPSGTAWPRERRNRKGWRGATPRHLLPPAPPTAAPHPRTQCSPTHPTQPQRLTPGPCTDKERQTRVACARRSAVPADQLEAPLWHELGSAPTMQPRGRLPIP